MLYIFLTLIPLLILLFRIILSSKYRFYYLSTAFITTRIWITFFAAMYFASDQVYMYEIEDYSNNSTKVTITIFILILLLLIYEKIFSDVIYGALNKIKKVFTINKQNFFVRYLMFFSISYLFFSIYLFISISAVDPIGSSAHISKFNIVELVSTPYIFKLFYALNPLLILIIAYGIAVKNYSSGSDIYFYNKKLFFTILLIGFVFHGLVYGYIQAKSHFILTYLMFFIVPIVFFNKVAKVKIFNNIYKFTLFISIFVFFLLIIFYMHYGNSFFEALFKRLLLEGQFLFVTLRDYFLGFNNLNYYDSFPKSGEESAIVQLMYKYIPDYRINYHENSGWMMSGAMPGFNFLFTYPWIGLLYWFFNFCIIMFIFILSLNFFVKGSILISFLYIKIYWYIVAFLALGDNYFYRDRFWFFILLVSILHLVNYLKKGRKNV